MLPAAYPKAAESTEAPTPPPATGTQKSEHDAGEFLAEFPVPSEAERQVHPLAQHQQSAHPFHGHQQCPAVLDGENVWLEFDAKDVASDLTTVEVVTPEGKTIKASFDLKKLR